MSHKSKRVNRTKEQLLEAQRMRQEEVARKKETTRRRGVARDIYYPILLKYATSIRHAQRISRFFESAIMTLHNEEIAKKTLGELHLREYFEKISPNFKNDPDGEASALRDILDAFEAEKLPACIEVIGGMNQAIETFINEEQAKRPLADLTTRFL